MTKLDVAQAEATQLREQLGLLQSKLCNLVESAAKDAPLDDDEPMVRTAAVLLHVALAETMESCGLMCPPTASTMQGTRAVPVTAPSPTPSHSLPAAQTSSTATFAHLGSESGPLGELRLLPSELLWIPVEPAGPHHGKATVIHLITISHIDDECETSAVLLIDLKDGDRIRLDFGSYGRDLLALTSFERELQAARETALKVAERRQPRKPSATETQRVREGRELREGLQAISKLKSDDRTKEARAKFDELKSGVQAKPGLVNVRAFELARNLFGVGGFELTQAVLDKFLSLRDVKQLLPEAVAKTRQQATDADTAVKLLEAAKSFFTVIMKVKGTKGGRRTDVNMNAFWASAASLLPRDVLQTRHGRSAARLLGIPYRVIKRASTIRADLEDSGVGWKLIKTNGHSDILSGRLISEFLHSDAASTEDNQNKEPITVYDGFDDNGNRCYCIHWRRALNCGWRQLTRLWWASPQCAEFKRLQQAEGRRHIVEGGRKLLKKFCCPCIKKRGPSECDDTITTFVTVNLPLWHRARAGYHQASMGDCTCHICSDTELRRRYRGMSASLWALQEALLPCGRQHFAPYDLTGEKPFKSYRGCCVSGACSLAAASPALV